ncbi:MAG: hypothetical protein HKO63_00760 [Acidimicrobiia bacterium]|nr:hypothetical protein [Acidimicrobiia bacterium]NNF87675.1 hypothetical protein [Acidimicrobiia bacterium]NNL96707.1 hypothetical protein [Acidimicrobiia bacterium]RZV42779.1 MAG: hypothetical protein EX267_09185 [Acidimicrobiia bacterium]
MTRALACLIVLTLAAAGCSGDDADTAPTTAGTEPTTLVTLVGIPSLDIPDAGACESGLPVSEWEIDTSVLLPGFVLPDGSEQPPATYRLIFQRGTDAGYASVPEAAAAATDWLPAEFQPDIRSIVINHLGRNYVFEGAVVTAGGVPGALDQPCLLLASDAQIAVWYSIQVVDPLGSADVYWVWQQAGRGIAIEPFEATP